MSKVRVVQDGGVRMANGRDLLGTLGHRQAVIGLVRKGDRCVVRVGLRDVGQTPATMTRVLCQTLLGATECVGLEVKSQLKVRAVEALEALETFVELPAGTPDLALEVMRGAMSGAFAAYGYGVKVVRGVEVDMPPEDGKIEDPESPGTAN